MGQAAAAWRFSANTGFLWKERPFAERIRLAAAHGFEAVEFHDEAQRADPGAVAAALAETGLPVMGMNVRIGETSGCAAMPAMADQARRDIDDAAATAARVGVRAIHVLAGKTAEAGARGAYVSALRHALAATDRVILIEPISPMAMPGYFLDSLEKAVDVIGEIGDARLKIMFDCFHMAAIYGEVESRFRDVAPLVGHVQIASFPDRAEPDGTGIDYARLLPAMRACGYGGAFGCEYRPAATVEAGLGWRDALRRRLPA